RPCLGWPGARGARRGSMPSSFATATARPADGSWSGPAMTVVSANRRRILSLWLPRLPIDRIKRKLASENAAAHDASREDTKFDEGRPCVVVIKDSNALLIHSLDEAAAHWGLTHGLPLANARAICPDLVVHEADMAADAKTLEDIACWCDRFTPLVALD